VFVEFSLAVFLHLLPLPASARPAPGHYFVSLAGDVQPEEAEPLATTLADQYHGAIEIVYLRGFRAAMSEAAAIELSRDPRVDLVARTDELSGQPPTVNGLSHSAKFVRTPGTAVPGRYHVILMHTVPEDQVEEVCRRIAAAYNLKIVRIRGQGVEVEGTEEDAKEASQDAAVHYVLEHDRSQERHVSPEKFVRVPDPLPGHYIVGLTDIVGRPTEASVRRIADELVAHYGGRAEFAWGALNAFSLEATEPIARALAEDPGVDHVIESQRLYWPRIEMSPEVHP